MTNSGYSNACLDALDAEPQTCILHPSLPTGLQYLKPPQHWVGVVRPSMLPYALAIPAYLSKESGENLATAGLNPASLLYATLPCEWVHPALQVAKQ